MTQHRSLNSLTEAQDLLSIDPNDLDRCLVEQPDLFYHVAEATVQAGARRDASKLDLENGVAELDGQIRRQAQSKDEKLTEASLQQRIKSMPKVQQLTKELMDAKVEADRWTAMKEAYQQRSFMLRELVARQIAQLQHLGVERGMGNSRSTLRGEQARVAEETLTQARQERRRPRGT